MSRPGDTTVVLGAYTPPMENNLRRSYPHIFQKKLFCYNGGEVRLEKTGLDQLESLPHPRQLILINIPINDTHIRALKKLKSVKEILLYGTGITPRGSTELQESLPDAVIEVRSGALLGIRGAVHPDGIEIIQTIRKGAASAGGLRRGDIITHWDEEPIRDFGTLVKLKVKCQVGGKIALKVIRDGAAISKEITLGRWGD